MVLKSDSCLLNFKASVASICDPNSDVCGKTEWSPTPLTHVTLVGKLPVKTQNANKDVCSIALVILVNYLQIMSVAVSNYPQLHSPYYKTIFIDHDLKIFETII